MIIIICCARRMNGLISFVRSDRECSLFRPAARRLEPGTAFAGSDCGRGLGFHRRRREGYSPAPRSATHFTRADRITLCSPKAA